MTNEQTALLLKGVAARLERAINQARDLMPEEAIRERLRRHTAPTCYGLFCKDESHYTESEGDALAISPLVELLEELQADSETLVKSSSSG